jgi:prepilin-type N-terminal cleavage/methylation domain-containing protein
MRLGNHPRGLSLVEVLMVIFIAGILTALVVGAVGALGKSSARQQAQAMMAALDGALDEYKTVTGEYPRIAGSFLTAPSSMTASSFAEATWMTYALTALKSTQNGPTLLTPVDQTTDSYNSSITATMPGFRTATIVGVDATAAAATASIAALDAARLSLPDENLLVLRDPWDRYVVYVPSHPSDRAIAATRRPMFLSAGPDGRLESIPWRVNDFSSGGTGSYAYRLENPATTARELSTVYFKQRHYACIANFTSSTNTPTPDNDTSRWQEITVDDVTTRGDWR